MGDWPEIEYEECYPVDEEFTDFSVDHLPLSLADARDWLLRELPRACEFMCCSSRVRDAKDIMGKPVKHIHFSTGGWSGAESIIRLIERRFDLAHHMLSWRRGGHYVFEIKAPEKVARPISEIRKQAWETRRAMYGPHGHNGSYSRPTPKEKDTPHG